MNASTLRLISVCASVIAGCSPTLITVEQAALDERVSRHFDGQHFGRVFFVDRHSMIDPATVRIDTGSKTLPGKKSEDVSVRWATISDADNKLLGFMIGSDAFDRDWLVPEMSEEEFRERWARCKGETECQDRLIDEALDDCERARSGGSSTEECDKHCWWQGASGIFLCL